MFRLTSRSTTAAIVLVALGCSDSDGSGGGQEATASSTSTGGSGGGGVPSGFELALHVDSIPWNRRSPWAPCEAAQVIVTLEDETELRGETDAEGNVTLSVPDGLEQQPADIVVFKEDHGWVAFLDQDLTDLNLKILLFAPDAPTVTVYGAAVGMLDPTHPLGVYATNTFDFYQTTLAMWSVRVPPSEPVTIIGLEWEPNVDPTISPRGNSQDFYQWVTLSVPALREETELSLDFTAPVSPTPIPFQGSFQVPDGNGILRQVGRAYMKVDCAGTGYEEYGEAFCGASERIDISADGARFEYHGEYLDVPGSVTTTYWINTGGGRASYVDVFGPPTDGPQPFRHLELPVVTAPLSEQLVWGEPITWEARDDLAELVGYLLVAADDGQVGRVFVNPGTTTIRWPAFPAEIDPADYDGAYASAAVFDPSFWTAIAGQRLDQLRTVELGIYTVNAR